MKQNNADPDTYSDPRSLVSWVSGWIDNWIRYGCRGSSLRVQDSSLTADVLEETSAAQRLLGVALGVSQDIVGILLRGLVVTQSLAGEGTALHLAHNSLNPLLGATRATSTCLNLGSVHCARVLGAFRDIHSTDGLGKVSRHLLV